MCKIEYIEFKQNINKTQKFRIIMHWHRILLYTLSHTTNRDNNIERKSNRKKNCVFFFYSVCWKKEPRKRNRASARGLYKFFFCYVLHFEPFVACKYKDMLRKRADIKHCLMFTCSLPGSVFFFFLVLYETCFSYSVDAPRLRSVWCICDYDILNFESAVSFPISAQRGKWK